jgi:hypothetical protein
MDMIRLISALAFFLTSYTMVLFIISDRMGSLPAQCTIGVWLLCIFLLMYAQNPAQRGIGLGIILAWLSAFISAAKRFVHWTMVRHRDDREG